MTDAGALLRSRTFRWNDGESVLGYEAVEASDAELVFFRWSHVPGEGRTDVLHQSREDFDARGPARSMPPAAEGALRAWLSR